MLWTVVYASNMNGERSNSALDAANDCSHALLALGENCASWKLLPILCREQHEGRAMHSLSTMSGPMVSVDSLSPMHVHCVC